MFDYRRVSFKNDKVPCKLSFWESNHGRLAAVGKTADFILKIEDRNKETKDGRPQNQDMYPLVNG